MQRTHYEQVDSLALYQVVHRGLRPLFGKQLLVLPRRDELRHLLFGVIKIAPMTGAARTKHHASWRLTLRHPLVAEGTFLNRMLLVQRHLSVTRRKVKRVFGFIPIE